MDSVDAYLRESLLEYADLRDVRDRVGGFNFTSAEGLVPTTVSIWGGGYLGQRVAEALMGMGGVVQAFIDRNPHLWGTSIAGIPVLAPSEACGPVVIATHHWREPAHEAAQLDVGRVHVYPELFLSYPDAFLPFRCLAHPSAMVDSLMDPRLDAALDRVSDAESRLEFVRQIAARHFLGILDTKAPTSPRGEEWFDPRVARLGESEVFLDGGAYDGDTLRRFAQVAGNRHWSAVAVEPDPEAFVRLVSEIANNLPVQQVQPVQAALGRECGLALLDGSGQMSSHLGEGGNAMCPVVTIDAIGELVTPTYVKLDLEGYEYEALLGASRTIGERRSTWAIAGYHLVEDFSAIPSLFPDDYSLVVAAYAPRPWDSALYLEPLNSMQSRP